MKRLICIALACMLISTPCACATSVKDDWQYNADILMDELKTYCDSEIACCAIIAMFYKESQFQSNAQGGWIYLNGQPHKGESIVDMRHRLNAEWTEHIDAGLADGTTRQEFIDKTCNRTGGYGLCQWLGEEYLGDLYDYAAGLEMSVGSHELQVAYTVYSIQEHRPKLWQALQGETDPYNAGLLVGRYYEGTSFPEGTAQFSLFFYNFFKEQNQ